MDQEIPQSDLPKPYRKLSVRVNESHLPGQKGYKGSVVMQRTLDIRDIAARVVEKRSEFRQETLVTTFNLLKEEIYEALADGYNVDFGFSRTELTVNGSFESLYEKFDSSHQTLTPRLRPAPLLKQRVGNLKAVNETYLLNSYSMPRPLYVSLRIQPRTPDSDEPYNQIPPGKYHFISIYGERLKLMGDSPEVGLYLRPADGSEERFYPPGEMIINTGRRLCFAPGFAFTQGEWVAEVVTQYAPHSRPYKIPRQGSLVFHVRPPHRPIDISHDSYYDLLMKGFIP